MATQDSMQRLWRLAGQMAEARKAQAGSQGAALQRQKRAEEQANRDNWFGPTMQGAVSGGLTGLMLGGPAGAAAGAVAGGAIGYAGREQFNENPTVMPMLGQAATTGAAMYNRNQPLQMQQGPDYGQMAPLQLQAPGELGAGSNMIELGEPTIGRNMSLDKSAPYLEDAVAAYDDMQLPDAQLAEPGELGGRRGGAYGFLSEVDPFTPKPVTTGKRRR